MSTKNKNLDTCGCCDGVKDLTPASIKNLPGLSAIVYRVGTHGSFKQTMKSALSRHLELSALSTRDNDDPSIAILDTWATVLDVLSFYQERIANEGYLRTATERRSILHMARHLSYELLSGVAAGTYLVFTIEDAPGAFGEALAVAASVQSTPAQSPTVIIDVGTKVQSIPGQDELPQTFETVEKIEAKVEWNALRPRRRELKLPGFGDTTIYLKGTSVNLKEGDPLLVIGEERENNPGNENWDFRRVKHIETVLSSDPLLASEAGYTVITLDEGFGTETPHVEPAIKNPKLYVLRERAALFGHNSPDWRAMSDELKKGYLGRIPTNTDVEWPKFSISGISDAAHAGLYGEFFNTVDFKKRKLISTDKEIDFDWKKGSPYSSIGSDTFSVRWSGWLKTRISGTYKFYTLSDDGVRLWVDGKLIIDNWTDHPITEDSGTIALDAVSSYEIKLEFYENTGNAIIALYWKPPGGEKTIIPSSHLYPLDIHTIHLDVIYSKILPGSWVVLKIPESHEVYNVVAAVNDSKANFSLSSKTTRLTLSGKNLRSAFNDKVRETAVYAQSENLEMAETPINSPVSGKEIVLEALVKGMNEGHRLVLSGKRIRARMGQNALLVSIKNPKIIQNLQFGDELIVMELPLEVKGNRQKWRLKGDFEVDGKNVVLEGYVTVPNGQIYYIPAYKSDETVSELIRLSRLEAHDSGHTKLVLEKNLQNIYDRATVTISGNVARATHGEGAIEVLGSGDGSQIFQKFVLKQSPLTFVSASTPNGTETTLEIRVNDMLWHEVPSFYSVLTDERVYITRIADDGNVTVQFGDGKTGARLPTGQENVKAKYRKGIGLPGLVKANQLSQLMTRPLGVKGAVNPLAPTGADDPEKRDMARKNAPLKVLTLDRIVSLQDFEDFTRAFAGIGKAQAAWLWYGEERLVHITASAADGGSIDKSSDFSKNLITAIDAARHIAHQVRVDSYKSLKFNLEATIMVDNDYIVDTVLVAVKEALKKAFAFEKREFGQSVTQSETLSVMQGVKGVIAVDLNKLNGKDPFKDPMFRLAADIAHWDGKKEKIEPAELLTIDPNGIILTEMK
jgi:hypothetical protein